ncbi:MAG TPA: hypothetical protein VF824_17810 [Thermoanaerobaculia bacterium]
METNYRLERWIALLLGLLFLLPFVARGDELLVTAPFHADEVRATSGAHFLALVCGDDASRCMLQPVAISATRFHDDDRDSDGIDIRAAGVERNVFLLRGARLHPGMVFTAAPSPSHVAAGAPLKIAFDGIESTLRLDCANKPDRDGVVDCTLIMQTGGTSQQLSAVRALSEAPEIVPGIEVHFAGDLDHDGRLDLIVDLSGVSWEWHPTLFLSSAARPGALAAKSAELVAAVDDDC